MAKRRGSHRSARVSPWSDRHQAGSDRVGSDLVAYCRRNPPVVIGAGAWSCCSSSSACSARSSSTRSTPSRLERVPGAILPPARPTRSAPTINGRDLLAVMVAGLPRRCGSASSRARLGCCIGIILGFIAGYLGGSVDAIIRTAVDTLLTVPGLLILITIAASIKGFISVNILALVVASLAWRVPDPHDPRAGADVARARLHPDGAAVRDGHARRSSSRELLPNLLPFLAASFVGAVAAAILASIGLEALGLGPQNEPTLGMTIYWAIQFNALLRGMWWWWLPPIVVRSCCCSSA